MSIFRKSFWQHQAEAGDAVHGGDLGRPPTEPNANPHSLSDTGILERSDVTDRQDPTVPPVVSSDPTARSSGRRERHVAVTDDEIYFSTKQAAAFMHHVYSHRSLERMRCDGTNGPPFIKMPGEKGRVLYPRTELVRWLKSQSIFTSTSQYPRKR